MCPARNTRPVTWPTGRAAVCGLPGNREWAYVNMVTLSKFDNWNRPFLERPLLISLKWSVFVLLKCPPSNYMRAEKMQIPNSSSSYRHKLCNRETFWASKIIYKNIIQASRFDLLSHLKLWWVPFLIISVLQAHLRLFNYTFFKEVGCRRVFVQISSKLAFRVGERVLKP